MPTFTSPARPFLDTLSLSEARDMLDLLLSSYAYRKSIADPDTKFHGREAQKALAKFLARRDAIWGFRELILNAGRTLYYTTDDPHPYYTDALLEVAGKLGEAVQRPAAGAALQEMIQGYSHQLANAVDAYSVASASDSLVVAASQLTNEALDLDAELTRSEAAGLAGIVDIPTKLRLKSVFF